MKIVFSLLFLLCLHTSFGQNEQWAHRTESQGTDGITGSVVNNAGDVFYTGFYSTDMTVAGVTTPAVGVLDAYVTKRDFAGNHIWTTRFGSIDNDEIKDICLSADGNILVCGYFSGSINLGLQTISSNGGIDWFYGKIDSNNGNFLWVLTGGGAGTDCANSISESINGDIAIGGFISGNATFGSLNLNSAGDRDIALLVYNSGLNLLWHKRLGNPLEDEIREVKYDLQGNLILVGTFVGNVSGFPPLPTFNFDGVSITCVTQLDAFVAKYTSSGSLTFAKGVVGSAEQYLYEIEIDPSNDILVGGIFRGNLFDGLTQILSSTGIDDILIMKYNASGSLIWYNKFGGALIDELGSMTLDSRQRLWINGNTEGLTSISGDSVLTTIGSDVFLFQVDPTNGSGTLSDHYNMNGFSEFAKTLSAFGDQSLFMGCAMQSVFSFGSVGTITATSPIANEAFIGRIDLLPATPEICAITVDSVSNFNEIYYDKSNITNCSQFKIYREATQNNYLLIGTVNFSDPGIFIDTIISGAFNGNPNTSARRYKISVVDTLGNESLLSPYHQTMFMVETAPGSGVFNWNIYQIENASVLPLNALVVEWDRFAAGNWSTLEVLSPSTTIYAIPLDSVIAYPDADYRIIADWTVSCDPNRVLNTTRSNIKKTSILMSDSSVTILFKVALNGVSPSPLGVFMQYYGNGISGQLTLTPSSCTNPVIYEGALSLDTTQTLFYRFKNGLSEESSLTGPCAFSFSGENFRKLIVPEQDFSLQSVCFDACSVCECIQNSSDNRIYAKNTIELFPNPFEEQIHFKLSESISGTIRVVNLIGHTVLEHTLDDKQNGVLNLSMLASGAYFVQICDRNELIVNVSKIVKR